MSKVKWIVIIIGILLLMGPLRRPFFREWRFAVPAIIWGYLAWVIVAGSIRTFDPWWMPWAVAICVALGAGAAGKEWLDDVFRKG